MHRLRVLLIAMLGAVLALALVAPTSHAGKQQTWVSGTGVADIAEDPADWACEDQDPENFRFASVFTSDLGPDRGLNGCWYFDFGNLTKPSVEIPMPGGGTQLLEYPSEDFVGTLDGRPVEFSTKGAVVVTLWEGTPFESDQVAGGCYHPLNKRDGRGAIVMIEQLEEPLPTVRYYGRISVK